MSNLHTAGSQRIQVRRLISFIIFVSIMAILAFTPIGMINFGVVSVLLAHIPVVVAYLFCHISMQT